MSEAAFHELFPLGEDDAPYKKLTGDHVALASFDGERVVRVMPEALDATYARLAPLSGGADRGGESHRERGGGA